MDDKDKPEVTPEPNKPEMKPEFEQPAPKSEFDHPEIKPKAKPQAKPRFKKERPAPAIRFRFKFFFIFFILASGIYFGSGPVVESVAKLIIRGIFVDSAVSIGSLSIKPTHQISFLDVRINKGKTYDVLIKEANLDFTWPALFKKIAPELNLKNVRFTAKSSATRLVDLIQSIKIDTKKKSLRKVKKAAGKAKTPGQVRPKAREKGREKTPAAPLSKLEIADLNIELDIQDARVSALVSLSLNLPEKKLNFLNMHARQLCVGKVALQDLGLSALQGQRGKGNLKVRQASLGKLKLKNIKSLAVLEGMILSLDDISGIFLSKKLVAETTLNLWPILECTANARVVGFSAAALVKQLGWEDRLEASGRLYAKAIFRSEGKSLAMLNVNFISSPAGAMLNITDPQTLQKIARLSKQPLTDVSANFRDYHYQKGQLIASLLEDALSLEIILDGQQGRRNLSFDFKDTFIFGAN